MRTYVPALVSAVLLTATPAQADACNDQIKANFTKEGIVVYTSILVNAAKDGRLYSREAAATGAHRFVREFVARQLLPAEVLVSSE